MTLMLLTRPLDTQHFSFICHGCYFYKISNLPYHNILRKMLKYIIASREAAAKTADEVKLKQHVIGTLYLHVL